MKFILTFLFCIFGATPVFAQSADGVMNYDLMEYFYQAPAGKLVVNLLPNITRSFGVGSFSTQTFSATLIGFGAEYGFTKNFSISVSDDIGSATYTSDDYGYTQTGTSNIVVAARANFDLTPTNKLTAAFSASLTPDKYSQNKRYLGSDDLMAQIGYQNNISQTSLLGFSFSTTASIPNDDYNSKTSYSSAMSASYEMISNANKYGFDLALSHSYSGADFANLIGLDVYANFAITNSLSLEPGILYGTFTDAIFHKDGIQQFDIERIFITARYAF